MRAKELLRRFVFRLAYVRGVPRPVARKELLRRLPTNSVAVEIGVWKGAFSRQILKVVEPRRLHLVDPWQFQSEYPSRLYGGAAATSQADMDQIYIEVQNALGSIPSVDIHRATSVQAVSRFEEGSLDWVYIDGNHSFDHVLKDLTAYLPKIKRGGWLVGDDFWWRSEEGLPVKAAVEAFLQEEPRATLAAVIGGQFMLRVSA